VLGSEKEYGIIALGSSTEAYLILKEGLTLTRDLLKIMLRYRFPVEIGTKSTLILRDLDILKEIDENAILPLDLQERLKRGVIISCSISTLDDEVATGYSFTRIRNTKLS
jgi:DNA repair photolyase